MFKSFTEDQAKILHKRLDSIEDKLKDFMAQQIKNVENEDKIIVDNKPLSVSEFAKKSNYSEHIIREDIRKGRIKTIKRGKRDLIPVDQLVNY
jgi:hypothetical protein